ncbi:MAG: radical SAM protein [Magnetococcales bacterium]|nr:radical SAM protein [Magnetococcales bacterium]
MSLLRSLHLAHAIARSNLDRPRTPYKLTFVVTRRCNSRCLHCDIWNQSEPPDPLGLAEIETFFKKYPGFHWIDLTGGEPFLRPDLPALTAMALRHSPRLYHLHLPTNAVSPALTIQRIQDILALDPPLLTITLSLDGPPEQHDTLRGVPGNWRHCLEVYHHFQRHPHPKLQLFFGFTLSDDTVGTLTRTMQAVRERFPEADPKIWHLNLAHHSAHYYGNLHRPVLSETNRQAFRDEINGFLTLKRRLWPDPVAFLESRYLTSALDFIQGIRHPMPCRALTSSVFVAPDGTCFPCSIWDRPIGHLRDHACDLNALLASAPARHTLETIAQNGCPGCWTPCDALPTILGNLVHPLFRGRPPP